MVAAADCDAYAPDSDGGCEPLHLVANEQARHRAWLEVQGRRIATLKVSVDAAKDAAERSEAAAVRAEQRTANIERVVCAPANAALVLHHGLVDEPVSESTGIDIVTPALSLKRIRAAEVDAVIKAREADAARLRAARLERTRKWALAAVAIVVPLWEIGNWLVQLFVR